MLIPSAMAQTVTHNLNVVLVDQTPLPAEPGKTVEIEVEIQNTGYGEASNNIIEILPATPFSLISGETKTKTIQNIPARSSKKATYNLFVDEDAATKNYDLSFSITTNNDKITKDITITVRGVPKVIIEDITIDPEHVEAGGQAELRVYVRNVGTGTARQLQLTLNATTNIIPVLSKGSVFLGDLDPSQIAIATMKISIDNEAEEKTYNMVLEANYQDESNVDVTKRFYAGIPVSGTVRLDILRIEPNFQRQTLEIEIANKGTTEAKAVEAQLFVGGKLVDIDYISQIRSTKKTTFSFPLISEKSAVLQVDYVGPGLEKNSIRKDIILSSVQPRSSPTSGIITAFVIIVIIGGIVYFWKFRKKRHHAKSKKH